MNDSETSRPKLVVGVLSTLVIILCSFYIADSISHGVSFRSQSASVIGSQIYNPGSNRQSLNAKQLYSAVHFFNDQIKKLVLTAQIATVADQKTVVNANAKQISVAASAKATTVLPGSVVTEDSVAQVSSGGAKTVLTPTQSTQSKPVQSQQLKLEDLISQRKYFMLLLAKADPNLFLLSTLSKDVVAKIPAGLQTQIENPVSLTGTIEVLAQVNRSEKDIPTHSYNFLVNKARISLYPTKDLQMISGGTLQISGVKIGDALVADTDHITVKSFPPPATYKTSAPAATVTTNKNSNLAAQAIHPSLDATAVPVNETPVVEEHKVLVLLVNYLNSPTPPVSNAQARQLIFNGFLNQFYQEQSYGKVHFSGDVKGWYTLPGECNLNGLGLGAPWNNAFASLVTQQHINLSNYDQVVTINNCDIANNQVTFGEASIGSTLINDLSNWYLLPVSYIDISAPSFDSSIIHPFVFTDFDHMVSQLFGFNLGLDFASGLDCGEDTLGDECVRLLDGNVFDIMGKGFSSLHFNAFYKDLLGWIPPQNSLLITQPGRYTISSLESGLLGQSKKLAKIKVMGSVKTPFYLELRKGVGFDAKLGGSPSLGSNQNGLMVNYVTTDSFSNLPNSRLLDMSATPGDWDSDIEQATLNVGQQFSDVVSGVTIGPVISANSSSITFDVGVVAPTCVRLDPLLEYPLLPEAVAPGDLVHMYVYYDNGDFVYCPSAPIKVSTTLPLSWQPTIPAPNPVTVPPSDNLDPGLRKDISFTVPLNTPIGSYPVDLTVTNQASGHQKTETVNIQVENPPTISGITPVTGSVGTSVTLTGSDFSYDPHVWMYGPNVYNLVSPSSDGNSVTFPIPSTMISNSVCTTPNCEIPTPPGDYAFSVSNDHYLSSTNYVHFQVLHRPSLTPVDVNTSIVPGP